MMWGWSGYGYNWIGGVVGAVVMLVVLGALVALAIWAMTSFARPRPEANAAENILRRRLTAGEITEQEYERLHQVLHSRS